MGEVVDEIEEFALEVGAKACALYSSDEPVIVRFETNELLWRERTW